MIDDHDVMVSCPNNPAHRLATSRMQFHLAKCNHVAVVPATVCRFNSAHQMQAMQRDAHERSCPDRKIVELGIVNKDKGAPPVVMQYVAPDLPPTDEDWGCDDAPTYDPTLKTLNAPVLRSLQGATKSERKYHRRLERERHQQLTDNGCYQPALANTSVAKEVDEPKPKQAYDYTKALRAPTSKSKTFDLPAQGLGMGLGRGRVAADMPGLGMGRGVGAAGIKKNRPVPSCSLMPDDFDDDDDDDYVSGPQGPSRVPEVGFPHLQSGGKPRGRRAGEEE